MLDTEPAVFIVGTAGAGKSTLTAAFEAFLQERQVDVLTVNLDPGAEQLPYDPGVDIRERLTIAQVMDEYGLGPNGAQVAAADLIAVEFGSVLEQIEAYGPDVVLVDTPGQLELFAFRASGPFIAQHLSANALLAFLFDPVVASNPRGFVSQAVLAATTHYRLGVPTLNVLAKSDTLEEEKVEEIVSWAQDTDVLMDALAAEPASMVNQLNEGFARVLGDFKALARLTPASAPELVGIEELYHLVSSVSRGGEDDIS